MKTISIEEVTHKAVSAALEIVDEATDRTSKKSDGPCGDELAYKLDELIKNALQAHFNHPDRAPAFVQASDLEIAEDCLRAK